MRIGGRRDPLWRVLRLLVAAVALAAILLLFVLPGRTFLSQANNLAATQRQSNDLASENAKLRAEAKNLRSRATIEQIAREQYGLVMPGESAYAVIPAAQGSATTSATTTTLPSAHRAPRPSRAGSQEETTTSRPISARR